MSCLRDGLHHGAAVLAVPMKATVKEGDPHGEFVVRTVPRERLWEIHTPQVSTKELFLRGFKKVHTYTQIYMHTYIYTYIYTYIHTTYWTSVYIQR